MTDANTLPFTWVPGMRFIDSDGDGGTVVNGGAEKRIVYDSDGSDHYPNRPMMIVRGARPDLDHAGTVALLLEQLRERLGSRVEVRACGDDPNDWAAMVGDAVFGCGRTEGQAILDALESTAPRPAPEPASPRAVPTAADFAAVAAALDKHVSPIMKVRQRLTAAGLVATGVTADDFLDVLPGMIDFLLVSHRKLAAVEAALEAAEVTP